LQVQYLASFEQDESTLRINLEGMDVSVIPRPHLIGETTIDKILNHSPAYQHAMDMHQPSTGAFQFLSQYKKPTNIIIAFGTWCQHCKKIVPTIMKTISECNNSNLDCSFIGISKDFDQPAEFLRKNKVKTLPSVIVFQEGKEIGRITGNPKVSMEDDLVAILNGS
jgi:thiol-disulfide isomerase/thioredoxin